MKTRTLINLHLPNAFYRKRSLEQQTVASEEIVLGKNVRSIAPSSEVVDEFVSSLKRDWTEDARARHEAKEKGGERERDNKKEIWVG